MNSTFGIPILLAVLLVIGAFTITYAHAQPPPTVSASLVGSLDHVTKGLAFDNGTLYSVSPNDNNLRTINPDASTNSSIAIGTVDTCGDGCDVTVIGGDGLATNSTDGKLFAILQLPCGECNEQHLVTIDTTSGATSEICKIPSSLFLDGLAFNSNYTVLFGLDKYTEDLYTIVTSGYGGGGPVCSTTLFTTLGPVTSSSIGFNPDDGLLYHSAGISPTPFFEDLNLTTKNTTTIDINSTGLNDIPQALTFSTTDDAFLWAQGDNVTTNSTLFKVSLVHNPPPSIAIDSQTPIPDNSQVFFKVTDFGANGTTVSIHLSSAGDTNASGTGLDLILAKESPGIFTNAANPLLITDGPTGTGALHVNPFDTLNATYGSNSVSSPTFTPGAGASPTSTDPVKFSSDRFTIETYGSVSIYDATKSGSTSVTVKSNADSTTLTLSLPESPAGSHKFTTQYAILFTAAATSNSVPSVPKLHVTTTSPSNTVQITYGTTTVLATITPVQTPTIGTATTFGTAYTGCTDIDNDGICDSWENQNGALIAGLHVDIGQGYIYKYPSSGTGACRPAIDDTSYGTNAQPTPYNTASCPGSDKKDIYVEVDYMTGHKPDRTALGNVVTAFANQNIRLHIQLDEDLGFHADKIPIDHNLLAGSNVNGFKQLKDVHFGTAAERTAAGVNKAKMIEDKRQIFHYAISIHDIQDTPTASGWGEIGGNDFIVSLGEFSGHVGSIDQQAGTFMHELGHNLGLRHGGAADEPNCKPNYLSVMNYAFQFPDFLPTRPLDYSRSALATLDEVNGLSESLGVSLASPTTLKTIYGANSGTTPFNTVRTSQSLSLASNPIDWDRSGSATGTGIKQPVHVLGISDCTSTTLQKLVGQNDWTAINLVFRTNSVYYSDGVYTDPVAENEITNSTESQIDTISGFTPGPPAPQSTSPTVNAGPNATISQGSTFTSSGNFTDADSTSWTATVDYGDGSGTHSLTLSSTPNSGGTFSLSHLYSTFGSFQVTVTVTNDRAGIGSSKATVTVNPIPPHFVLAWGSFGTGNIQFKVPSGVAVDPSGNVYVSDTFNNRIEKFSSTGAYLTKWGSAGSGNGQFNGPIGIAVDSSGHVYVSDSGHNRIEKFSSTGAFITKWGSTGSGNGQFIVPSGVAVDPSGNVYVADTFNNRIEKFSSTGAYLTKWGSAGSGNGQFNGPIGIAVDSSGHVYVSDSGHNRIEKFSSTGAFITKWGSSGSGNGQFIVPSGVGLDSSGNVYVSDSGHNRIEKFSSTGAFITKWGSTGSGNGQFKVPLGIAVDSSGNVYVADSGNNRIEKFAP